MPFEQTLYLDHPRPGGDWSLIDTAAPHETTENHWRFKLTLPPNRAAKFVVQAQQPLTQSFILGGVSDSQFLAWVESRFLDPKVETALRESFAVRREIAEREDDLKELAAEREKIHAEQKRIRDNLGALGDRASEKELRERFVRTLNQQEDRLESIAGEKETLRAERDAARERLNGLIGRLDYEGAVPGA